MPDAEVQAEVLEGRLASPVAARATLDSAAQLVDAMPTSLAAEPEVFDGLQRLACDVETAIAAAERVLGLTGNEESSDDQATASTHGVRPAAT